MAKSEDVGIKELPHWLYEPMIKKHGSRIKEELQGIIENRCQENIIQHHVHLIQLVENGMPLPHDKGGKEEKHNAISHFLLLKGGEDHGVLCKKGIMWE